MIVKLLTEHHLEFLSLKGGCRGSSQSTLVKMSNCLKSFFFLSQVSTSDLLPNVDEAEMTSALASLKDTGDVKWDPSKLAVEQVSMHKLPAIPSGLTNLAFASSDSNKQSTLECGSRKNEKGQKKTKTKDQLESGTSVINTPVAAVTNTSRPFEVVVLMHGELEEVRVYVKDFTKTLKQYIPGKLYIEDLT